MNQEREPEPEQREKRSVTRSSAYMAVESGASGKMRVQSERVWREQKVVRSPMRVLCPREKMRP